MTKPVVTRFAPSPTGFLHIGGARTALFNWLFAKANGGKMLLRIEDTDRQRSTQGAVDAILDGLSWLGLDWDGEPSSQFAGVERHMKVAHALVTSGHAYKCFCTKENLDAMREKAMKEGRNPMYDGTCREKDPSNEPEGTPYVIRLKTPLDGTTDISDQVQGNVSFPNADIDDFILLRSDGTPTYLLAVVVDDHDMGVTHIIRGDDHLTNAAKQTLIYQSMEWDIPVMAHIPLIHGMDGAKLSKRHGAIGAETYRAMGYLPEALRNYLVKLGWAHGDDEIMSTEQMTEWFGFEGMNKAAARFDHAKLDAINAHYMKEMSDETLLANAMSILPEMKNGDAIQSTLSEKSQTWLAKAVPALKDRSKTLVSFWQNADFLLSDIPLNFEEKASKLVEEGKDILTSVLPELEKLDNWSHAGIDGALRNFCEARELKLGKVAQPIRAALTGKASSPGAFDVLEILGKEEAVARIRQHL